MAVTEALGAAGGAEAAELVHDLVETIMLVPEHDRAPMDTVGSVQHLCCRDRARPPVGGKVWYVDGQLSHRVSGCIAWMPHLNDAPPSAAVSWRRCLVRVVGLILLWLAFFGTRVADLWVGVVAACIGTWVSYRLLPQTTLGARPLAVARVVADFAWYSVLAGADVAARALDPRRRLHPGLVAYRTAVPEGPARNAFAAFESLMPGTMPAGYDESGRLLIHCLDVDKPVTAGLLKDERQLRHALGRTDDG